MRSAVIFNPAPTAPRRRPVLSVACAAAAACAALVLFAAPSDLRHRPSSSTAPRASYAAFLGHPGSARHAHRTAPASGPTHSLTRTPVRVLLAARTDMVRIKSSGPISAVSKSGERWTFPPQPDWLVVEPSPGTRIAVGGRAVASAELTFSADNGAPIELCVLGSKGWSVLAEYPGQIRISRDRPGPLSVINVADLEEYVEAVVAQEVWPTFSDETLRVQSILARSFVMFRMQQRREAPYDVTASQASQVYRGIRRDELGRRAATATRQTVGLACVHDVGGQPALFSAYYSACCGGVTLSEAAFGKKTAISPLRGGVQCPCGRVAPGDAFRWDPVEISLGEVTRRLKARLPELSSLGEIRDVRHGKMADSGQAISFILEDTASRTREVLAYDLRTAIGSSEAPSAWFDVRVNGSHLQLLNGRGHGHGVGVCQWGAEALARDGRSAADILTYFYPTCRVKKLY